MTMPPDIRFYPLEEATFVSRPNRFVIFASVRGLVVKAACRDPGRLEELLRPGARLLVQRSSDPRRRTAFTVILVRHYGRWVSMVPSLANPLFEAALRRPLKGLETARVVRREVPHGRSRLDFEIEEARGRALVEVKSATLVDKGRALFPDAPTLRGKRHLDELREVRRRGGRAYVVFVVQRDDATSLSPNERKDPAFAAALRTASREGVEILAFRCRVTRVGIGLDRPIPVVL